MSNALNARQLVRGTVAVRAAFLFAAVAYLCLSSTTASAQPPADDPAAAADDALANVPDTTPDPNAVDAGTTGPPDDDDLNFLQLIYDGGIMMVPIGAMLILVITFMIERILGLRRSKVLPEELTRDFGRLSSASGGFDPRRAYRICQQYPCAASSVIRAMLLKIGRPHSEVEHAVNEANEREAARLYSNVRWLNLAAAVAPLMGLFGTVWGMIKAFYATANLPDGASKAEVLADGIVVALMTTLGGLFVAIPAAIAAHFFEGRIQGLFREIDELLFSLLPQVERYEGKLRVSREQLAALEKTQRPEEKDTSAAAKPADSPAARKDTRPREQTEPKPKEAPASAS